MTAVGENAFKGNTALTSVSVPDGVVKIGAGAFEGCSNLMTIIIGVDVANIGDKAFANIGTSTKLLALRLFGLTKMVMFKSSRWMVNR